MDIEIQKSPKSAPRKEFWVLNIAGWAILGLINIVFQTDYLSNNFIAIAYSVVITLVGIGMSLFLRMLILKLKLVERKFLRAITQLLGISLATSFVSVLIFSAVIEFTLVPGPFSWDRLIGNTFNFSLTFLVWTFIYVSFLFFEQQQNLAAQKLRLSLQLKDAELNILRKQLSPHFLFNALNNIRAQILVDPEAARTAILDVSDLLRYALNYQKKKNVTVDEEMEIVQAYINLNKTHLGEKVQFEIDIAQDLGQLNIPPMSIQLLVENAIKHGALISGGLVSVSVQETPDHKLIEVINPGVLKANKNEGIGLNNLKKRLSEMYKNSVEFSLSSAANTVKAQIKIS